MATASKAKTGEFNKARYDELLKKVATDDGLTDTEHDEFVEQLSSKRASESSERSQLETLAQSIVDSSFTFAKIYKAVIALDDGKKAEVNSLFSAEEIAAAAKPAAGKGGRKSAKNDGSKIALIKLPTSGQGRATTFFKGQDIKKTYTQAGFKDLSNSHGAKFAEELKNHYTPDGTKYFATPEGQDDLAKFIESVQKKNAQPASKTSAGAAATAPAKKATKTPAKKAAKKTAKK